MRRFPIARPTVVVAVSAALALVVSACQGSAQSSGPGAGGSGQGVAVQVSPASTNVATRGTASFAATVTGSANTAVTWTVVEAGGGTIDASGHYTAPTTAGSYTIRATSAADGTVHGDATVNVTAPAPGPAVTVAISPSPASTNSCLSLTFSATVGNTSNTAVTWSVQEGTAGGSITAAGVYTAPATAGTYHVVATSGADSTKKAVSTVTVTDRIISVAVNPSSTSLAPGGTTQFTATVTTTCGAFVSTAAL